MDGITAPQSEVKHLNCFLVAGCSIGHKPHPLYVSRWDMSQTKKFKVYVKYFFLKMVPVILGKVHFSAKFGFI